LSLHEQVKHLRHGPFKQMQELTNKKEEQGELTEKEDHTLKDLIRQAEDEIIRNAEVICTTCVAAFDRRLRNVRFR
jgi:regulator of nonsense transcripts 1